MAEKRFTYLDASRNKYIGSFFCNGIPLTNQEVVDLLNENEQLKQFKEDFIKMLDAITSAYVDLLNESWEENEQLKIELIKQNDFKDKVFNLINTKLKEADEGFKMTYDSWYQGQVDALKELKKELIKGKSK